MGTASDATAVRTQNSRCATTPRRSERTEGEPVSDAEQPVEGVCENQGQAEIKGGDAGDAVRVCALTRYSC
jgi:hypothetical protein